MGIPYKKGDIELLEKVQKRATKLIPVQSSNWTSDLFSTYSYIFNVN